MIRYKALIEKAVTVELPSYFKKKVYKAMGQGRFTDEDITKPDFVENFNSLFKPDGIVMITPEQAKSQHKIDTSRIKSWQPDVGLDFGFYDPQDKIIYVVEDSVELFLDSSSDWYYPAVEQDVVKVLEEIIGHELVHKAQFEALPKDLELEVEEGANITSKTVVDYFGGRDEVMAYAQSAVKKFAQNYSKAEILKHLSYSPPDPDSWERGNFWRNNNFFHIYRMLFDPKYSADIKPYTELSKAQVVSKYKDTWKVFLRYVYEFTNKL